MVNGRVWLFAYIAALVSVTTDAQESVPITVRVLSDGQNCIVYTQQMRCDAVGFYLRDNRHLAFSQPINVFPDGTGDDSLTRGLKTRDDLAKVGYSKIVVVGFLTEPGAAHSTSP
jgi:hypothetical protein